MSNLAYIIETLVKDRLVDRGKYNREIFVTRNDGDIYDIVIPMHAGRITHESKLAMGTLKLSDIVGDNRSKRQQIVRRVDDCIESIFQEWQTVSQ